MSATLTPIAPADARAGEAVPLVRVRGLRKTYRTRTATVEAVAGVDLDIVAGEVHALVGESGSGKTTLARCILRLVEPSAGSVELDGVDVLGLRGERLRALRREMQLVFQDPQGSLDPRMAVRDLIAQPLATHGAGPRSGREATVRALLDSVGLDARHLDRRPHELSGGQCQRVAIARALAVRPRLLVLDEPTSALDVSVQAQILNLLLDLRAEHGLTYLLISHDLGVVRYLSDRVSVMYLGRIVERQAVEPLFDGAAHPYTRSLIASLPGVAEAQPSPAMLVGDPARPSAPPPGCAFHPRCWLRARLHDADAERCRAEVPPPAGHDGRPACHFPERVAAAADVATAAAAWQEPAHVRWGYVHIPWILRTSRVPRGGTVTPLPRRPRDVLDWTFAVRGQTTTVGAMLERTDTDGFLVLHGGRIIEERYGGLTREDTPHLLQSVTKSVVSGLAGVLTGAGLLDPDAPVTRYVEELRGGSFEGAAVQDLLDMRAGTRFSEAYEDLDADIRISEQVTGWRARSRPDLPPDLYRYIPTLANDGPHHGPFRYRSILSDLLGWVIERAGGAPLADLLARHLWGPMGAEHDAVLAIDPGGAPVADGGLCVTLRDLGRFGLLHLRDGVIDGRRVIPAEWIRRVGVPRPDLVAAFGPSLAYDGVATPTSHYHDQWWVFDAERGIYGAIGIHGQALVVHRPADAVIAKLSTHADALDRERHELQLAASIAIGDRLEREGPLR